MNNPIKLDFFRQNFQMYLNNIKFITEKFESFQKQDIEL